MDKQEILIAQARTYMFIVYAMRKNGVPIEMYRGYIISGIKCCQMAILIEQTKIVEMVA